MDIAAPPLYPSQPPDSLEVAGRRIDWTGRDVVFGILWFIAIFIGAQVLILPFALVYGAESSPLYASAFLVAPAAALGFALVAANFTFRRYGGSWERLGFGPPTLSTFGWAVAAFMAAFLFSAAYSVAISRLGLDFLKSKCAEQIPKEVRDHRNLLALASLYAIAFAPICEELFFRGFVFTGLTRRWGLVAGIIASGLIFVLPHLTYKAFIPIAGVGIIFAFTYARSRNILSTMMAHVAFNSVSIAAIAAGGCNDPATGAIPLAHALGAVSGRVLG